MRSFRFDMAHSSIGFSVRHMLVSRVHGSFTRWSGELRFDEAAPHRASVVARIDATSIDTREPRRDEHLQSIDFLDARRFPFLLFESKRIARINETHFEVAGALTIRGVTRNVLLEVEYGGRMRDPSGAHRVGFSARAVLDRKSFGVSFNEVLDSGGLALGNKVEIVIDVEAVESASEVDAEQGAVAAGLHAD